MHAEQFPGERGGSVWLRGWWMYARCSHAFGPSQRRDVLVVNVRDVDGVDALALVLFQLQLEDALGGWGAT